MSASPGRPPRRAPRGDGDIPEPARGSQPSRVRDVFEVCQRLRIGVGNTWTMVFYTEFYNGFRREIIMPHLRWCDLRNLMVLTVQAAEVAARTSD